MPQFDIQSLQIAPNGQQIPVSISSDLMQNSMIQCNQLNLNINYNNYIISPPPQPNEGQGPDSKRPRKNLEQVVQNNLKQNSS